MTGAGNDFIVIDNRFYRFSEAELACMARRICMRRHGIGADGILAYEEARNVDFGMVYINADGTPGTMCANGARCLVRYAQHSGVRGPHVRFAAASGTYDATLLEGTGSDVRLLMVTPKDLQLNLEFPDVCLNQPAHYIWTGTEHVVCFVNDISDYPVAEMGRAIRRDNALAPEGANVNFVQIVAPDKMCVRTYEKGVESETLACGTGAVASAVVGSRMGRIIDNGTVQVEMPGGSLLVGLSWPGITLDGPAEVVFRGTFELEE